MISSSYSPYPIRKITQYIGEIVGSPISDLKAQYLKAQYILYSGEIHGGDAVAGFTTSSFFPRGATGKSIRKPTPTKLNNPSIQNHNSSSLPLILVVSNPPLTPSLLSFSSSSIFFYSPTNFDPPLLFFIFSLQKPIIPQVFSFSHGRSFLQRRPTSADQALWGLSHSQDVQFLPDLSPESGPHLYPCFFPSSLRFSIDLTGFRFFAAAVFQPLDIP